MLIYSTLISNYCYGEEKEYSELIVTLKMSGVEADDYITVLQNERKEILIPLSDLNKMGIRTDLDEKIISKINGAPYLNISIIPDSKVALDPLKLTLDISLPPQFYMKQEVNGRELYHTDTPITAVPGAFLGYNFTVTRNKTVTNLAGTPGFTAFSDKGTISSDFVAQYTIKSKTSTLASGSQKHRKVIRLETNWTSDNVEKMARWRVGDSITRAADWSGSARFGGIQYATNFAVNPNFVSFPLLDFAGRTSLPTTLEVYSKSLSVYSKQFRPGDFQVTNLPITTGSGDLIVETTDITGRKETITMPYYVTPVLLKKGLSSYSYELGASRQNFSLQSNKYRYLVTNADYKYGINNNWTTAVHWESMKNLASVGISNYFLFKRYGVFSNSIATNLKQTSKAQVISLGYSYQVDNLAFNTQISHQGRNYYDIYSYPHKVSSLPRIQTSLSYSNEKLGNITGTLTALKLADDSKTKIINFAYEKKLLDNAYLTANLGRTYTNGKTSTFAVLSFNVLFGNERVHSAQVNRAYQAGTKATSFQLSSPASKIPLDWGYRTTVVNGQTNDYDLELDGQSSFGAGFIRASSYGNSPSQQVNAAGNIVYIDKSVFFTPPVYDSVALVKVSNFKDIPIYYNNQLMGNTNNEGKILVPYLPSYVPSQIRLDNNFLPLDSVVSNPTQYVASRFNSGTIADFPIKVVRPVEIRLVDYAGYPLPLTSLIKFNGIEESAMVGYDGKVYLDDIGDRDHLEGELCYQKNRKKDCCHLQVEVTHDLKEPITNLGNVECDLIISVPPLLDLPYCPYGLAGVMLLPPVLMPRDTIGALCPLSM